MKNKKISKSLKRHHNLKKVKKEVKTLLWFILIVSIVLQVRWINLAEASFNHNFGFPQAEDKTEIKDLVIAEIITQARIYGVDEERALKIAYCESRYDTQVRNWQGSSASGLWQYTIGTWQDGVRWRGLDWTLEDRFDYKKSTDMTMWFVNKEGWGRWECNKLI